VFVGNLSFDVTREELVESFGAAGKVMDAKVPTDRETGRPRGFAFVEFESEDSVQRAVALLNGQPLKGRPLRVSEAEDRPPRAPGAPRPASTGFRPSGSPGYRPGLPAEPLPAEELRSRRARSFDGKPAKGRPWKEKGPRRVERRQKNNAVIDDEDY
jgi:cold-inducible RNA-binding protein